MNIFAEKILKDKHAVISGGTSGINQKIASTFASAGAKVSVFGRDAQKAKAASLSIAQEAGVNETSVLGFSADVRNYESVQKVVQQSYEQFGAVDIVVAGAAGNFPAPALDISPNGFKAVVDIDLLGTFHLFRAAYDYVKDEGASFIAISAEQATVPHPLQAHVCAAKAGVNMVVKVLAMEWAPVGVRVNAIVPGPINDTEGMTRLAPTQEARAAIEARIPLQRYGNKGEVADLALFLCSDAAQYINGVILECDGGAHLGGLAASFLGCART